MLIFSSVAIEDKQILTLFIDVLLKVSVKSDFVAVE